MLEAMSRRKPFASFEEQVSHIKERGLALPCDNAVTLFPKGNSYYRFSYYMRAFVWE